MKYQYDDIERVAMTLRGLPFVTDVRFSQADAVVEFGSNMRIYDAAGTVTLENGTEVSIVLEMKRHAWPSMLDDIMTRLPSDPNVVFALVSPRISEDVRAFLQEQGVSWFDGVGNCFFKSVEAYALITGLPDKKTARKDVSAFERSATVSSRVLRCMLEDARRYWRVAELAEEASCSIGMVSRVKQFLERRGFLEIGKLGFRPANVEHLMQEWAAVYNRNPPESEYYYAFEDVSELEMKLARLDRPVFLTGVAGGVRYAPAVRYGVVDAYLTLEARECLLENLDVRPVESGANLRIRSIEDESTLQGARMMGGDRVVSPVQAYLDCMASGSRGEEEARAVLEKVILP